MKVSSMKFVLLMDWKGMTNGIYGHIPWWLWAAQIELLEPYGPKEALRLNEPENIEMHKLLNLRYWKFDG